MYQPVGEQWNDPAYINLLVEHSSPTSLELHMHSYGGRVSGWGRNSIVAWTSPVDGRIRINGHVRLPDLAECPSGSGIRWSIYQDAQLLLEHIEQRPRRLRQIERFAHLKGTVV